ncbi:MAG: type VI secretion system Vgr family protein [Pseudomonadota bacterium]
MRLSFPHHDGPDDILLANRLEGDEALSRDFTFTVEVLADNARIPLKSMLGKMVCIALVRGDGSLRYCTGYVFEFALLKTDGGIAFYSMVLKPWLAYLRLRDDNYLFHNQTLRQQTNTVFQDYGAHPDWDCQLGGADPAMTMACQFGESDYNYLHRRWEAAGWHYRYEHTESGHKLVLSDDSTYALPIDGASADIAFQRHAGSKVEEAIGDWSAVRRIVVGKVALSAFDFKRPRPITAEIPTLNRQGTAPLIESYEYRGAYGFGAGLDGDAQSRRRMEEIETGAKHIDAQGNNPYVVAGRWFRLTGHFHFDKNEQRPGQEKNEFLVVAVRHQVTNNYLQADASPDYRNQFTCLRKTVAWRPQRGFNSIATKIMAPQTALVVATEGHDIDTDQYGRAKVQFHWDRGEGDEQHRSTWLRVMRPAAGAEQAWGGSVRHLQEVVVAWLGGEPDLPFIMGSVPNARNMPPWRLPAQQALSGIRSRELGAGKGNAAGGRSNHLVLDDTAGKIQAQLKSDHLHSQLSLGHITRIEDSAGRKDSRGEGFALETEGAGAVRSPKGLLLTTDGRSRAVGGTLSRDELVRCLEQALDVAKGLGGAAAAHLGAKRDAQPQQALSAAVDALGHGVGNEAEARGPAPGGQPVVAISGAGGIASATPKDQLHYAGDNFDTIAGKNQQHYAMGDILHTAAKNIEHFAVDGDLSMIANKGKLIQQAQHNAMELTADKSLTITSVKEGVIIKAEQYLLFQVGGSFLRMTPDQITIDAKTLNLQSDAPSITAARGASFEMPKFDVGNAERKFVAHFDGDKAAVAAGHNYKLKMKDGRVIEGVTDAEGRTVLAQEDAIHIAELAFWKTAT